MWQAFLAFLASLAADPVALDREAPRAAAAVAVAYASQATDASPAPPAPPKPDQKCQSCGGRGYIIHADGHRTDCPNCDKFERMTCPDGKCPTR